MEHRIEVPNESVVLETVWSLARQRCGTTKRRPDEELALAFTEAYVFRGDLPRELREDTIDLMVARRGRFRDWLARMSHMASIWSSGVLAKDQTTYHLVHFQALLAKAHWLVALVTCLEGASEPVSDRTTVEMLHRIFEAIDSGELHMVAEQLLEQEFDLDRWVLAFPNPVVRDPKRLQAQAELRLEHERLAQGLIAFGVPKSNLEQASIVVDFFMALGNVDLGALGSLSADGRQALKSLGIQTYEEGPHAAAADMLSTGELTFFGSFLITARA